MNLKLVKVITIGLSILFISSLATGAEDDDQVKPDDGRFKIFIAEHNAIVNGKNTTIKSIFKMDRETGVVWRYRQGVDSKGKPYEEFFEVPNQ